MVSTRLRGGHLGLKGVVAEKIPYSFKATYTVNYGVYNQSESSYFESRPWQLSLALDAEVGRRLWKLPVEMTLGVYGDIGELYQNSIGLMLKISYSDLRRF